MKRKLKIWKKLENFEKIEKFGKKHQKIKNVEKKSFFNFENTSKGKNVEKVNFFFFSIFPTFSNLAQKAHI